ncbi:unnamed protein product [Linum trigynum]|uniref:Uncharacterized protein n=1 Tax=Linum trigynum TaxID=586398 RepID=A0AAV2ELG3_9ROSI
MLFTVDYFVFFLGLKNFPASPILPPSTETTFLLPDHASLHLHSQKFAAVHRLLLSHHSGLPRRVDGSLRLLPHATTAAILRVLSPLTTHPKIRNCRVTTSFVSTNTPAPMIFPQSPLLFEGRLIFSPSSFFFSSAPSISFSVSLLLAAQGEVKATVKGINHQQESDAGEGEMEPLTVEIGFLSQTC